MLDPTDGNISQENLRRVLEKFFLELDPSNTALLLRTAYKQFFTELSTNLNLSNTLYTETLSIWNDHEVSYNYKNRLHMTYVAKTANIFFLGLKKGPKIVPKAMFHLWVL